MKKKYLGYIVQIINGRSHRILQWNLRYNRINWQVEQADLQPSSVNNGTLI